MNNQEILSAFQSFYERYQRMPSVREVRDIILKTRSNRQSQALIEKLVEEGMVRKDKEGRLQPTSSMLGLRMLGKVEAGWPSPAEEELADTITLDEWLIQDKRATFMLTVSGSSMIGAGIRPGDTAIVKRGMQPQHGDIVIACVDNKWTMKYFHKLTGNKIVLVPANPKFKTIYPKEELRIEAVVTAIIRKYK